MRTVLLVLVLLPPAGLPAQNVLHVPSQYRTIQDAVKAAKWDDTILVAPGQYVENVVIDKNLTLKSTGGAAMTTIDGGRKGTVVSGSFSCTIEGFTITGGLSTTDGGGISGYEVKVRNNIITGNQGLCGGGIWPFGSGCYIENNVITHNVATGTGIHQGGGGIGWPSSTCCHVYVSDNLIAHNTSRGVGGGVRFGYGSLDRNIISNNTAGTDGGGIYSDSYEMYGFDGNLVYDNRAGRDGGGVFLYGMPGMATNNFTVVGNTAEADGGGLWCKDTRDIHIADWILWNNKALRGAGPELWLGQYTSMTISHSLVKNGKSSVYIEPNTCLLWGGGMLTVDPRFVDESGGDLHLTARSPCVDAGSRRTPTGGKDIDGDARVSLAAVDIGADEFHPTVYVTGTPIPGGAFTIKVIGPPGAPVLLGVSLDQSLRTNPVILPGMGSLWLDAPFIVFDPGPPSPDGVVALPLTLPATFPKPYGVPLQALVAFQLTRPYVMKVR